MKHFGSHGFHCALKKSEKGHTGVPLEMALSKIGNGESTNGERGTGNGERGTGNL